MSLRVYGHEGTGADRDKELSCSTIEQVYGFAPYDEEKFKNALSEFEPAGWTPLAGAYQRQKSRWHPSIRIPYEFDLRCQRWHRNM